MGCEIPNMFFHFCFYESLILVGATVPPQPRSTGQRTTEERTNIQSTTAELQTVVRTEKVPTKPATTQRVTQVKTTQTPTEQQTTQAPIESETTQTPTKPETTPTVTEPEKASQQVTTTGENTVFAGQLTTQPAIPTDGVDGEL